VARGATGEVRRDGTVALKLAHPLPEARARLLEEVRLHRRLEAAGLPLAPLLDFERRGRWLTRRWLEGRSFTRELTTRDLHALFALRQRCAEFELRHQVRVDFSPSNLLRTARGPFLVDGGPRLAAPRFQATTLEGFRREWRAWFAQPPQPRLQAPRLPPSGRFHVETNVGRDPRARIAWVNQPLLERLGLDWREEHLLELAGLSTTAPPTTTRPSTRYTDMVGLDLKRGPRGDGRVIHLGVVDTELGTRELSAKGVGPTPLAWKGRAFHEDGRVSLPRTLWEVTVADELARLGFDTPEYLCVATTSATTVDNTNQRWPAGVGVRLATHTWRLGHLRAVMHDRERFEALRAHVLPGSPRVALARFCDTLGFDVGRADALQIHCFNATPGNVRLDGHLIDYSTVRFMPHHLPRFRFLEGAWTINRTRAVWSQQAMLFAEVLCTGGALPRRELKTWRTRALRRFLTAYQRGVIAGLARVYGFDPRSPHAPAFATATLALREVRGDDTVHFEFFKQHVPGPRFDVLGRAPEVVAALGRRHTAPWKLMVRGALTSMSADDLALAKRWTAALSKVMRAPMNPTRRWSEVIRPFLEPERLARQLYGVGPPGPGLSAWARAIASPMPEGRHSWAAARRLALQRGHVEFETLAGTREVVVGLSPELLERLRRTLRRVLGARLVGVVAHGSRVVERAELRRREPTLFTKGDLRSKGRDGGREFGPSRQASSDLDLKIFVTPGPHLDALEQRVSRALTALGAWFPIGSAPRQRLLVTRSRDVTRAFRAWNGGPRFRLLGKGPIPEQQAVVLID
jgi:hypothetical protein